MAGDWIKMRVSLAKDPRVIAMADYLSDQPNFINWITSPTQTKEELSAYRYVTRNVTVSVTVAALLQVWGAANEAGKPDGDDLVMHHTRRDTLDEVSGVPCFGEAMEHVEWATEECVNGKMRVRLPKFLINNVPAEDRAKRGNADRQRRYREKHNESSNAEVTVTRNVTVTHREEKIREENKDKGTPSGVYKFFPGIDRKLVADFAAVRKAKRAAITQTAIDGIQREANKAGLTMTQALTLCCERGWSGFKASWLDDDKSGKPQTDLDSALARAI